MAGVPSSLLRTLSDSQAVTKIPITHMPMTSAIGFADVGTKRTRTRAATAVPAMPGAVLTGSFGYELAAYLD